MSNLLNMQDNKNPMQGREDCNRAQVAGSLRTIPRLGDEDYTRLQELSRPGAP